MTKQELLARTGEAAIRQAQAARALAHAESHGQTMQIRKDRAALDDANRALAALVAEAEHCVD